MEWYNLSVPSGVVLYLQEVWNGAPSLRAVCGVDTFRKLVLHKICLKSYMSPVITYMLILAYMIHVVL